MNRNMLKRLREQRCRRWKLTTYILQLSDMRFSSPCIQCNGNSLAREFGFCFPDIFHSFLNFLVSMIVIWKERERVRDGTKERKGRERERERGGGGRENLFITEMSEVKSSNTESCFNELF